MPFRLDVDPHSGYPIYLQLVEQVQRAIAIGVLAPGEQLPTIKQIAGTLIVNPSTVARALRELEHLRIITTRAGRGSYVADDGPKRAKQLTAQSSIAEIIARAVREARALSIDGTVVRDLFERAYRDEYAAIPTESHSS